MRPARSLSEGRPRGYFCLRKARRTLKLLRDWGLSCVSFGGIGHLATIACFVLQTVCLDIFLIEYLSSACLVVLFAEIPLGIHLVWYWRQESAAKAAPLQWFVYSWIHGAKVVVLFCKIMPQLPVPTTEVVDGVGSFSLSGASVDDFFSSTSLANILLLTPVFYTLLMFRTGKAIFGSSVHRISVDLIMHYDMLWHVVIDIVDIISMFHYARLAEWLDPAIVTAYPSQIVTLQTVLPFLLFLSTVLHGQSLPGVFVDEWRLLDLNESALHDAKEEMQAAESLGESDSMLAASHFQTPSARIQKLVKEFKFLGKRKGSSASDGDRSSMQSSGEDAGGAGSQGSASEAEGEHPSLPKLPPLPPLVSALRPATSVDGRDSSLRPVVPHADLVLADEAASPQNSLAEEGPSMTRGRSAGSDMHASFSSLETHLESPPRNIHFQPTQANEASLRSEGSCSSRRNWKASGRRSGAYSGSQARAHERHLLAEKMRIKRAQAIIDLIQRHTVVIARKRSAIVSIFFIDMPFLCIRLLLWLLSVQANAPHFPGLGAKNGVCFLLNTLQFTLVQMATSEGYAEIQRLLAEYRWHNRSQGRHKEITSPLSSCGVESRMGIESLTGLEGTNFRPSMLATPSAPRAALVAVAKTSRGPHPSPLDSEATPYSGSASTRSTPAQISSDKGSPHVRSLQREREQRGISEAEFEIRRETRRPMSICAHFWAVAIAFSSGILLTQASQTSVIQSVVQWLSIAFKSEE